MVLLVSNIVALMYSTRAFEFVLVKLTVNRSDLTPVVEVEVGFNWGNPRLAAAEAANPDIAVNHLVLHNRVLAAISARGEAARVARTSRAALFVGADAEAELILASCWAKVSPCCWRFSLNCISSRSRFARLPFRSRM